jgi:hypothetical protein
MKHGVFMSDLIEAIAIGFVFTLMATIVLMGFLL